VGGKMKKRPDLWQKEKEIIDLYLNKGLVPSKIAKIFNCNKTTIQTILKSNKIKLDNKRLRIHHIDYNKKKNKSFNLISLYNKCHIKTNTNRKHWTNYFKMKMFIVELFDPRNIIIFNENKQLIGVNKI
jgi:DNA-binding CsgD family transcriptional regulator